MSNRVLQKKKRGPPATGKTPVAALRLPDELRARIDAWIGAQPDPLTRSEAIRRLLEKALAK
jgi:Arc/MetJ-type ribon-helix-helix transcriptional regulator